MKRNIYKNLLEWKNKKNHKSLLVLGVRQCGKTYIIDKFIKENYKKFKKIDLSKDNRLIDLYNTNAPSDEKYTILNSMVEFDLEDDDSVLFIDEVQLSGGFISELKYLNEVHPKVNIICAGSLLGVKLKKFKGFFPVGKIEYLYMYPMSFDEYLLAFNKDKYIDLIKDSYKNNKFLFEGIHNELIQLYRMYLITGGMPDAVKTMVENNNTDINAARKIINDITESYLEDMTSYVENTSETLKIRALYESIPRQLGNTSHKFQITKVEDNSRSREYDSPLEWLLASNMVLNCFAIKEPKIPLELCKIDNQYKLYLSDVGILSAILDLTTTDILTDNLGVHKGIIAENYVATELVKNNTKLYYWSNPEVDFVTRIGDDIIPIEVKAANNTQSKALKAYIDKFNPKYSIRVSTKNFGYNPNSKVKSIPLYAIFCINKYDNK